MNPPGSFRTLSDTIKGRLSSTKSNNTFHSSQTVSLRCMGIRRYVQISTLLLFMLHPLALVESETLSSQQHSCNSIIVIIEPISSPSRHASWSHTRSPLECSEGSEEMRKSHRRRCSPSEWICKDTSHQAQTATLISIPVFFNSSLKAQL